MLPILETISKIGIVPVVKLDDANKGHVMGILMRIASPMLLIGGLGIGL